MVSARHATSMAMAMLGLLWVPVQTVGQLPNLLAKLELCTIGTEPAVLTAAEIVKVTLLANTRVVANAPVEGLPVPAGPKPPEKCTIEVGPPGLNYVELAKACESGYAGGKPGPTAGKHRPAAGGKMEGKLVITR